MNVYSVSYTTRSGEAGSIRILAESEEQAISIISGWETAFTNIRTAYLED